MKYKQKEFRISQAYVCAIEYGDMSGLEEDEIKLINDFVEEQGDGTYEYGEEVYFTRCEINKMMSDCVDLKITWFK